MDAVYNSFIGSHNGISYSVIIIFGAFIFLMLMTLFLQQGRITDVLRKGAFFSMILLYAQAILALMMAITDPQRGLLQGSDLFLHFKYPLCIFISAGLVTFTFLTLKKTEILTTKTLVIALSAALIYEYAFPWSKVFGA